MCSFTPGLNAQDTVSIHVNIFEESGVLEVRRVRGIVAAPQQIYDRYKNGRALMSFIKRIGALMIH